VSAGIVICSRLDSSRLPGKCMIPICGAPIIEHLIKRLVPSNLPIYIAVPDDQFEDRYYFLTKYKNVKIVGSPEWNDPLKRMFKVADHFNLKQIIRISHDKIFVNYGDLRPAVDHMIKGGFDYVYSSKFVAGSGFEVISIDALKTAAEKYSNVEFIGYAIKSVTSNISEFNPRHPNVTHRLLIDYPQDVQMMDVLMSTLGPDCQLEDVVKYLNTNPELKAVNNLPKLTMYTCAYNAEQFIERCMESVAKQYKFKDIEYIIIDDCSTDTTLEKIAKFCTKYPNTRWIKNQKNLGLASSSNIALKEAKGSYIMRLDADDFLVSITAMHEMLQKIEQSRHDVIYPDNYFGNFNKIQDGSEKHHVGGAIFNKAAINHIKFTDGLRGYEGLDFFLRAKEQLEIGYLNKPIFFYTQRPDSMSKTNKKRRAKIKSEIEKRCA